MIRDASAAEVLSRAAAAIRSGELEATAAAADRLEGAALALEALDAAKISRGRGRLAGGAGSPAARRAPRDAPA